MKEVRPLDFSLASITHFSFFLLGAINTWLLLTALHKIPFFQFLQNYIIGYNLNLFMPSQVGDAALVFFLKRHGVPYHKASTAYGIDKCITLMFVSSVAWIGARFYLNDIIDAVWFVILPMVLFLLALGLGISLWMLPCSWTVITKIRSFLASAMAEIWVLRSKWHIVVFNVALTILKWAVMSITFYLAFRCIGIAVKWPEVGIIPIMATLVGYVPISLGGIGTIEFCAVYLFGLVGVDQAPVLAVYLIIRFITYIQAFLIAIAFVSNEKGRCASKDNFLLPTDKQ